MLEGQELLEYEAAAQAVQVLGFTMLENLQENKQPSCFVKGFWECKAGTCSPDPLPNGHSHRHVTCVWIVEQLTLDPAPQAPAEETLFPESPTAAAAAAAAAAAVAPRKSSSVIATLSRDGSGSGGSDDAAVADAEPAAAADAPGDAGGAATGCSASGGPPDVLIEGFLVPEVLIPSPLRPVCLAAAHKNPHFAVPQVRLPFFAIALAHGAGSLRTCSAVAVLRSLHMLAATGPQTVHKSF